MPPNPSDQYLAAVREKYKGGDATERSYYGALETLLKSSGTNIHATPEPKRSDCGAPDFHIKKGDLILGHIEAKDLGASLDDAEKSEQIKERYLKALPNLILTNFLEFRWYVKGEHRKTIRLGEVADHRKLKKTKDGSAELADLLKSFLSQKAQGAANAKDLAVRLAYLAHEIRTVVVNGFAQDLVSHNVKDLRDAVKRELIPALTDEDFADLFSQTLAYGFFGAWCNHPTGKRFRRLGAAGEIPKTNPLLRDIFELMTGNALDVEPFVCYVDDLVQLLDRTDKADILTDFTRTTGRADPVVHFYETFLHEYDPDKQKLRGVYYTPQPVVSYMVRSVDHLLKTRFGLKKGLADTAQTEYEVEGEKGKKHTKTGPRVLILDPACGTGTFLFEIVNHIRDGFIRKRQSGAWSSYVREHLLPRLFGFELLMAPYAMAHLKLGLQLAGQDLDEPARSSYAYDFGGKERLGVYLTNSLDPPERKHRRLPGPLRVISDEADAAAQIKREKPILVVIANPPYSSTTANRNEWIGQLVYDYKRDLNEKKTHLENDYVKFLRFAQWRVQQTGRGIVAMITDNSYLDGLTHRRMRASLLETFDDIWILNLHGNSRRKEVCPDGSPDSNVFQIREGTAIIVLLALGRESRSAEVHYADVWGSYDDKAAILASQDVACTPWQRLTPTAPSYWFIPTQGAHEAEYSAWPSTAVVFPVKGNGFKTDRDPLCLDLDRATLQQRMKRFFSGQYDAAFRNAFGLHPSSSYDPEARRDRTVYADEHVTRCICRPFDVRHVYYDTKFTSRPVAETQVHMLKANTGLLATRQTKEAFAALATRHIAMQKVVAVYDANSLFPLYLYPHSDSNTVSRDDQQELAFRRLHRQHADQAARQTVRATIRRLFPDLEYPRWPNLDPLLLADLEERLGLKFIPDGTGDLKKNFGPEDVFNYIYAILHSPTYRERYAELLKRDFPRIPFTSDRKLFAKLAEKGRWLVALHLLESDLLSGVQSELTGDGENKVDRVRYDAKEHRVYINKTQHFPNVPSDVWNFKVGGYQVCDKWLKDRKGRPLSYDDQEHYTKVTIALRETIRLMQEIDAAIPSWPIT